MALDSEKVPFKVLFIQRGGENHYAKNRSGDEYYPETGQYATNQDNRYIYARDKNGFVIYPINKQGDEEYIQQFSETVLPEPRPGVALRYAITVHQDEIYPKIKEAEFPFLHRYARLHTGELFYPTDPSGHEYHFFNLKPRPKEYPITNDRFYIVPEQEENPYFLNDVLPKLEKKDIVGKIAYKNLNQSGYVTNIRAKRKARAVFTPYELKPMSTTTSMDSIHDPVRESKVWWIYIFLWFVMIILLVVSF